MAQRNKDGFTYQMRVATKHVHKISDNLVNAKLAFALPNNEVWADGLLVFYEIFKFLENHVQEDYLPAEYRRTSAFEEDLNFYLGADWKKTYVARPEVQKYLKHLNEIADKKSILLIAYVYHLYMGLLSGGQILLKKRALIQKVNPLSKNKEDKQGEKVTHFEGHDIRDLKNRMRELFDEKAKTFDEELKAQLIEESRKVFELNNVIIRSVKGVDRANLTRMLVLVFMLLIFILFRYYFGH